MCTWIAMTSRPSFGLLPVALARNLGFSPVELRRMRRMLQEHETTLLEKWNARFGT